MTDVSSVIEDFLADKGKGAGNDSGTYRRDATRELDRFLAFLADRDVTTFEALDQGHMRAYARHLSKQGWANGTTLTYYAIVAAFCGWAVREGHLTRNVARRASALEPLPDDQGRKSGDQQAWSSTDRRRLTAFVDSRARESMEEADVTGERTVAACRDRALVYLLAYSGVRGAEVLAHRDDDRRNGLRWGDVTLDDRFVRVFSKKQEWDERGLPEPVVGPLETYRRVLDPPSDAWPVFPTLHRPTLSNRLRAADVQFDGDDGRSLFERCLAGDVAPPSMTTDGGRSVLRRLCEDADVVLDDGHDYLQPHGARRGAGEVLVRTFGHAAAARALDNSEEVVRRHYSHIEAGELADQMTRAFEDVDES